jgi:hypothetical protein
MGSRMTDLTVFLFPRNANDQDLLQHVKMNTLPNPVTSDDRGKMQF